MTQLNETMLYTWFDSVWNKLNENKIDELMASDALAHGVDTATVLKGPEAFKTFYKTFTNAFTDINVVIKQIISENGFECAIVQVNAKDVNSQTPVSFPGMCMIRLFDGKIAEAWNYFDFESMNAQLAQTNKPSNK
jgi:predicted ester cyclase